MLNTFEEWEKDFLSKVRLPWGTKEFVKENSNLNDNEFRQAICRKYDLPKNLSDEGIINFLCTGKIDSRAASTQGEVAVINHDKLLKIAERMDYTRKEECNTISGDQNAPQDRQARPGIFRRIINRIRS